jgi:hypothetical protein
MITLESEHVLVIENHGSFLAHHLARKQKVDIDNGKTS